MAFNPFKKKDAPKKKKAPKADVQGAPEAVSADSVTSAPLGTSVIRHMHVSEKSSMGNADGHYTFVVSPGATKPQVAKEVEKRYHVSVRSVKIVNLPRKSRRVGRYTGFTSAVRKAVVMLKEGQSIATI
jgi:large subunit ribosomal protein L23